MQSTLKKCFLNLVGIAGLTGIFLFISVGNASAEIEIEADPLAFALKGHSFHLILSGEMNRFDLGAFALELPEDSNNENYTVFFNGYGVKWVFFGDAVNGGFIGIQASSVNVNFTYNDPDDGLSSESTHRRMNSFGFRVGYRFGTDGFYITPWISVDKNVLMGNEVKLGGVKYQADEITFFPTVHLGYRF